MQIGIPGTPLYRIHCGSRYPLANAHSTRRHTIAQPLAPLMSSRDRSRSRSRPRSRDHGEEVRCREAQCKRETRESAFNVTRYQDGNVELHCVKCGTLMWCIPNMDAVYGLFSRQGDAIG